MIAANNSTIQLVSKVHPHGGTHDCTGLLLLRCQQSLHDCQAFELARMTHRFHERVMVWL